MTSEEFRRNPMFLRNQFSRNGTFEVPIIIKEEVSLENLSLIGYDKLSSGKGEQVVHFFLDDYKFEVLWNDPEPRIDKLSAFKAVLSPQFSIYTEMPVSIQIYNTFRNRWCGAYLQSKGIKVIPSVVWGEADTYWFCFDGIEKGSIVAVSTIGVRKEKDFFLAGYREMLRRIEPTCVVCYGKPFDEMEGNVLYISYEETNNFEPRKAMYDWLPKNLTYCKGGGVASNGARFPKNDSQIKHIFRKKDNHFQDTPENRALLKQLANDESKYIGTDENGNRWYAQVNPDGSQLWVTVRNDIIQNGGLNPTQHTWDDETGLNTPRRKGETYKMDNAQKDTLQGKAFLAMYSLLKSVYSTHPYGNLAVVMGDINPYIWKDCMSGDPASWDEFCEFFKDSKDAYSTEFDAAYYTCIKYLRQYEEEWDYPIPYAMEAFTREKYWEYYYNQEK